MRRSLLGFAIAPRSTPATEPTYREGIEAYLSVPAFRETVNGLAAGLGIRIVDASERGLVVAPMVGSLFAFSPRDFRPGSATTTEARVLDGLFMLAIVAACYPRAADLAEVSLVCRRDPDGRAALRSRRRVHRIERPAEPGGDAAGAAGA